MTTPESEAARRRAKAHMDACEKAALMATDAFRHFLRVDLTVRELSLLTWTAHHLGRITVEHVHLLDAKQELATAGQPCPVCHVILPDCACPPPERPNYVSVVHGVTDASWGKTGDDTPP